ncbi:MAG: preprotein translocase subunit YajC [Propionibacteriaceae bacterium]|nr:preprotein translocase subunit YajC [Propionibacteriaceae bacterium]
MLEMLLPLVAFGALFYFLLIRPQQKRMREHQETINALQPGTRVLLQSGLYGTLTHVGDKQAIVEFAPGVEVTTLKGAILRVVTEDEEEFEFDDDTAPGAESDLDQMPELPEENPGQDEATEKN